MKGLQISYNVKQGFKIKAYMRWFAEYNYHKKRKSSKMIRKNFEINKSTEHILTNIEYINIFNIS